MRPQLRAVALTQRGLVTRAQCQAAGYGVVELRSLLAKHGPWCVVRRGVYLERHVWESTSPREQQALHDLAVHLMMVTDHVMSHDSAARALQIPMFRPRWELTHVTREGVSGSRTEHGVKHHLTRIELDGVAEIGGLPVTSPARTALDLAREHGRDMGVAAVDHVLHHGLTDRRTLERELRVMWSWPYRTTAALALELADDRAESIAESGGRMLLVDLGFTEIDAGWPILVGGRTYWVDLRVGCHLIEVDGLHKLLPVSEGGIATRSTRLVLRDERARQQAICAQGLGMSRLMPDELFGRRRTEAMARIAAEEAVTRQRFGPDLPAHLAESAAIIRRTRPRRRPA